MACPADRTRPCTARFRSTLAAGDFHLFYQPVVEIDHNLAHHYEALARFDGAESSYPTIRLAEEVGGIIDLDLLVVRKVLQTLNAYPEDCRIAVNISATSLMTPRGVDTLMALTAAHGAARSRLLVKAITFDSVMSPSLYLISHLYRLKSTVNWNQSAGRARGGP